MSDTVILEKGKPILYRFQDGFKPVEPKLGLVIEVLCKKFE